jgi:hypothetical protein
MSGVQTINGIKFSPFSGFTDLMDEAIVKPGYKIFPGDGYPEVEELIYSKYGAGLFRILT